jgi:hypothetical protein
VLQFNAEEGSVTTENHSARITLTADEAETVRFELQRILASPLFQGSKRCYDFLHYIVTRTLEGELDGLTERFLGAELFGRAIDYDTKSDSIVRVRANDVRRRLTEYYADQRSTPKIVISLSAGSYIPEFQWPHREDSQPAGLPSLATAVSVLSTVTGEKNESLAADQNGGSLSAIAGVEGSAGHARPGENSVPESENSLVSSLGFQKVRIGVSRRVVAAGSVIAGLVILALAICSVSLWQALRSAREMLNPWQNSPAVAGIWGPFLADQKSTDLVITDSSFSLVEDLTHKSFNLTDYLSRSYMGHLQDQDPRMASALSRISNWGLGSSGEFEVAQRFLALDPTRQKLHFYLARKYQPDLIRRDNVILIGSRFGNPWAELFEKRMNFIFNPENTNQIVNRAPKDGESRTYEFGTPGSDGYCIIAYLPTPDHNGNALLIQGTSGEPTEAGGDFLLSEEKMSGFLKTLGASRFPYFELLLKTSWVKGTPIDSSIVAYRTYPGLH